MTKENKDNLSGVEVLLVIFSTLVVLIILTIISFKFIYPPEYLQLISQAIQDAKTQIIQLTKIIGPFVIGLILLLIGTIVEEKHRKKIFTKVKENTEAEKLIKKQLNPDNDHLFRIIDEELNSKTEKEKENFSRKEKENSIKRQMEMELAEVDEENLEKPYNKNFIPEFPNVYFYAEDDEIRVEEQDEDLISKVQELGSIPEEKKNNFLVEVKEEVKKNPNISIPTPNEIIDKIIDSFSDDMENLPLEFNNQDFEIYSPFLDDKKESEEDFTYLGLELKPVIDSIDQIEAKLDKEDLEIIGNDSQPKGIFYKKDLKKTNFTFEKYIIEELSSAIRLNYEICFFIIDSNPKLSNKLSEEFGDSCECFVLKNKSLFVLPFYKKIEVKEVLDKYNYQCKIIEKRKTYQDIKEALVI